MPFYSGPGWQQSSEPYVTRKVHLNANDGEDIVWPCVAPHDTLTNGEHPVLAIGPKANRPRNITGVVITYDSDTDIAVFNLADKAIVRAYVANILTYAQGAPASWVNTVYPGMPVYVDDSPWIANNLSTGCTLSFARTGAVGENPLAGYVWWCQNEYADSGVGGPNSTQGIHQPAVVDTSEVLTLCVILVNDHGAGTY